MSDYEVVRQRHIADAKRRLPDHLQRIGWSAERLRAERTERLRALVAVARAQSPWHRRRLSRIDPATIDEDRLADLPVMTKDDLMRHFDEIVTDRRVTLDRVNAHLANLTSDAYLLDDLHAVASGGSSGLRGVFVWDWEAWADAYLVFLRSRLRDRPVDPAARPPATMMVAAEKASHLTSALTQTFAGPAAQFHSFPVTWPVSAIAEGLNRVRGDTLVAYASMLSALAAEARAGRLSIAPQRVVATSEPLLPETRLAAERAWGAPVGNVWGTSEAGLTAVGCFRGEGMHLTDDLVVVEPVDARGAPVRTGTRSAKVYLTNLFNPLLPLIRYEITDEVTLLDEPCPCGSAFRRIADIHGRLDDLFHYEGGVVVHPHVFRSVLGRDPAIIEYQVRQTARGADLAVRCAGPVALERIQHQLRDELVRLRLDDAAVEVRRVEHLHRQDSGKLKRFIPLSGGSPQQSGRP